MHVPVRRATLADREWIVEANRRLAAETENLRLDPEVLTPGVTRVLQGTAEAFYLIATADDLPIGQMMLTREWSDWRNGWFYWIQSVYVAAEARRRGVFRALYQAAVEQVEKEAEAVGLRLYYEEHNHAARDAYLKLGMSQAGYLVLERTFRRGLSTLDATDAHPAP